MYTTCPKTPVQAARFTFILTLPHASLAPAGPPRVKDNTAGLEGDLRRKDQLIEELIKMHPSHGLNKVCGETFCSSRDAALINAPLIFVCSLSKYVEMLILKAMFILTDLTMLTAYISPPLLRVAAHVFYLVSHLVVHLTDVFSFPWFSLVNTFPFPST